jgi:hypothetical protein
MTKRLAVNDRSAADNAERALGRYVVVGLPTTAVVGAVAIGILAGPGPALLVLAGGTLLGTIALLWSSVRTLSGDAPLPEDLEALAARRHGVNALAEQKGAVLRALKDLEHEHAIGKIDDADFARLIDEYRGRAKNLLRQMDKQVDPLRPRAEQIAAAYLKKRGLADPEAAEAEPPAVQVEEGDGSRPTCTGCGAANDADASFCKKCGRPLAQSAENGGDDGPA